MGKLALYKCDRCKKEFTENAEYIVPKVAKLEAEEHERIIYILCPDCDSSFYYWLVEHKSIDEFINVVFEEE